MFDESYKKINSPFLIKVVDSLVQKAISSSTEEEYELYKAAIALVLSGDSQKLDKHYRNDPTRDYPPRWILPHSPIQKPHGRRPGAREMIGYLADLRHLFPDLKIPRRVDMLNMSYGEIAQLFDTHFDRDQLPSLGAQVNSTRKERLENIKAMFNQRVKSSDIENLAQFEGKVPSSFVPSKPNTEVKVPHIKAPEVKAPEAKAPEAKAPEAKAPEAKAPEAKAPEVKAPEVKAPEVKAPEAKAPEAKAPSSQGVVDSLLNDLVNNGIKNQYDDDPQEFLTAVNDGSEDKWIDFTANSLSSQGADWVTPEYVKNKMVSLLQTKIENKKINDLLTKPNKNAVDNLIELGVNSSIQYNYNRDPQKFLTAINDGSLNNFIDSMLNAVSSQGADWVTSEYVKNKMISLAQNKLDLNSLLGIPNLEESLDDSADALSESTPKSSTKLNAIKEKLSQLKAKTPWPTKVAQSQSNYSVPTSSISDKVTKFIQLHGDSSNNEEFTDKFKKETENIGKKASAGIVQFGLDKDKNLHVVLYKPKNAFGGYEYSLSKGRIEKGDTALSAAVREAYEETGILPRESYKPEHLGNYEKSTTNNAFFIGSIGDMVSDSFGKDETESVEIIPIDEAISKLGSDSVDAQVLMDAVDVFLKNPEKMQGLKARITWKPFEDKVNGKQPTTPKQPTPKLSASYPEKGGEIADMNIPDYSHLNLVGGQAAGGSTGAKIVTDENTGDKYLLKTYGGDETRVGTELFSNAMYRLMGADVAPAGIYKVDGKLALTYKLIDGKDLGMSVDADQAKELGKNYLADALLGSYDFFGLVGDNILKSPDGTLFRIDQGGTLSYRAQGKDKPYESLKTDTLNSLFSGLIEGQGRDHVLISQQHVLDQLSKTIQSFTGNRWSPGEELTYVDTSEIANGVASVLNQIQSASSNKESMSRLNTDAETFKKRLTNTLDAVNSKLKEVDGDTQKVDLFSEEVKNQQNKLAKKLNLDMNLSDEILSEYDTVAGKLLDKLNKLRSQAISSRDFNSSSVFTVPSQDAKEIEVLQKTLTALKKKIDGSHLWSRDLGDLTGLEDLIHTNLDNFIHKGEVTSWDEYRERVLPSAVVGSPEEELAVGDYQSSSNYLNRWIGRRRYQEASGESSNLKRFLQLSSLLKKQKPIQKEFIAWRSPTEGTQVPFGHSSFSDFVPGLIVENGGFLGLTSNPDFHYHSSGIYRLEVVVPAGEKIINTSVSGRGKSKRGKWQEGNWSYQTEAELLARPNAKLKVLSTREEFMAGAPRKVIKLMLISDEEAQKSGWTQKNPALKDLELKEERERKKRKKRSFLPSKKESVFEKINKALKNSTKLIFIRNPEYETQDNFSPLFMSIDDVDVWKKEQTELEKKGDQRAWKRSGTYLTGSGVFVPPSKRKNRKI